MNPTQKAAFERCQRKSRLLEILPRRLLRADTIDADLDALMAWAEDEITRAAVQAAEDAARRRDARAMNDEEWNARNATNGEG